MRKFEAEKLMAHFHAAQTALAAAAEELKTLENEHEADSLRRIIAGTIGTIAADAMAPIIDLFPELDPYDH